MCVHTRACTDEFQHFVIFLWLSGTHSTISGLDLIPDSFLNILYVNSAQIVFDISANGYMICMNNMSIGVHEDYLF